jgi:hypothetical protein
MGALYARFGVQGMDGCFCTRGCFPLPAKNSEQPTWYLEEDHMRALYVQFGGQDMDGCSCMKMFFRLPDPITGVNTPVFTGARDFLSVAVHMGPEHS